MNVKANTGARKSQGEDEDLDAALLLAGEALAFVLVFFCFEDIVVSKFKRIERSYPRAKTQRRN